MTRDYAAPDWRGLCEELAQIEDALSGRAVMLANQGQLMDGSSAFANFRHIANRARAALAQPEPEVVGPTDEEIADAFAEGCRDGSKAGEPPFLRGARAVLARWGRPAPPAEGEVAEVAAWLRAYSDEEFGPHNEDPDTRWFARAANLLEQRHPAPVPVAERLPGAGDCDAEGFCWWFSPSDPSAGTFGVAACWVLRKYEPEDDFRTHWLPATALPLPQGEVQP